MTRIAIAAALAAASLAAPAFATDVIHTATTEMGYTVHPDHATQTRSRADVIAEIDAAKKNGTWNLLRVGAPLPPAKAGKGLTREEVEADLLRAQQHPSWSARRVGAPVSMP